MHIIAARPLEGDIAWLGECVAWPCDGGRYCWGHQWRARGWNVISTWAICEFWAMLHSAGLPAPLPMRLTGCVSADFWWGPPMASAVGWAWKVGSPSLSATLLLEGAEQKRLTLESDVFWFVAFAAKSHHYAVRRSW